MDNKFSTIFAQIAAFMNEGGSFMWVILVVWLTGLALALERFVKLKIYDVDGPSFMNEVQKFIISNDLQTSIKMCSKSRSALARMFKNALKRSNQNLTLVQNAIDATILESVSKIEKRLPYLSLLANISTLFGLLGTIFGLIDSFAAVAAVDPTQKAEILSSGISKAMNTTALGLLSAISIMGIAALLNGKAEKIIGELDEFGIKLIDLLSTRKRLKTVAVETDEEK